ncbi:hypothetical protein [Mycolicibacterium sp.]|uniref:hypothetical protein n=1 Tax=Mycolicibacterium sp. TaxID=2320850 RepID=UPI0037C6291C
MSSRITVRSSNTTWLELAGDVLVWVRIKDDGDYIYSSDYSVAVPVTAQALRDRIDHAIATDVSVLRRRRGLA